MNKGWLVIVNPKAGNGKTENEWELIEKKLKESKIRFYSVFTKSKNDALDITNAYVKIGFYNILVVGGDGTVNEVVNGIYAQQFTPSAELTLAVVPTGNNNKWAKETGAPFDYAKAINAIKADNRVLTDIGKAIYTIPDRKRSRYFVNGASVLFNSGNENIEVSKNNFLSVIVDGKKPDRKINMANISLAKYESFKIGDKNFNDEMLKMVCNDDIIIYGKTIIIESETKNELFLDGDQFGHTPVKVEILPVSLQIIVSNEIFLKHGLHTIDFKQ